MRDIKFRGKRVYNSEWVYGNLVKRSNGKMYVVTQDYFDLDGHHLACNSDIPVFTEQETIGQYTGLKDKNGVEIYEGDLVNIYQVHPTGEDDVMGAKVVYLEAMFILDWGGDGQPLFDETVELEVVGNVHEE